MKKGFYSDREIISALNKHITKSVPKELQSKLNIYSFKAMGQKLQGLLQERSVAETELHSLILDFYKNPLTPPAPEVVIEKKPSKEELLAKENVILSVTEKNGKEVITFSEKGKKNLHSENNPEFEDLEEEDEINGHEDDGRIFKTRRIKRVADGKIFSYDYIWHSEWGVDFWDNSVTEE